MENSDYLLDGTLPSTPRFLILIALLFVPGVYLVLLLSAAIPIAMWFGLVHEINQLPDQSGSDQSLERMIGFGAIIATYACLRGISMTLFRKPRFELAIGVDLNEERKLNSFIADICNSLGTNLPDAVILHAEPTFFVQTGKLKVLNAEVKRKVLAISLPLLSGLSLNELRTILVHEFAHFTGNDTLYSSIVLPVYVGTQESMAQLLAEIESKAKDWQGTIVGFFTKIPLFIPYGILYVYLKLFQLLDMKLSRLREKRADYIAALTCGSKSFSSSLKKTVRLSRSFQKLSREQIIDLLIDNKAYINYYSVFRHSLPQVWESSSKFEADALAEKEHVFSSHPTLQTRLQYIPDIPEKYNDTQIALSLIDNLDTYEKTLTEGYTEFVAITSSYEIQKRKELMRRKTLSKTKDTNQVVPATGEEPKRRNVRCENCYTLNYASEKNCSGCGASLS